MSQAHNLAEFMAAVAKLLPAERVLTDGALAPYRANCLSLQRQLPAALRPVAEQEVQAIVRTAAAHGVPLYSVSCGHNWGYGTYQPVVDGCVIVDLSLMNQIGPFDPEIGLITLQPGVTQQQLSDFLRAQGDEYYVPITGAGPSTSIVGNALERGFGITPDEDHFHMVASVRAVLADGSVYQSCHVGGGTPLSAVWKWGVGPYLDGLFAQGNVGIVTALQIALVHKQEYTGLVFFTLPASASVQSLVSCCRHLLTHLRGNMGGIKVFNRQQLVSTIGEAAADKYDPQASPWLGVGVFRCCRSLAPAVRRELRRVLRSHVERMFFADEARLLWIERLLPWLPPRWRSLLQGKAQRLKDLMNVAVGIPSELGLGLVYRYVEKGTKPADPIRDGVGMYWFVPILPLKPDLVAAMLAMIEEVLGRYGFPTNISFTTINERCAIAVIPIIYRRPGEAPQAAQCFEELWRRGHTLGCSPYRVNVAAMPELIARGDPTYWRCVAAIKQALDPQDILSPGRYAPTNRHRGR